MVDFQLKKLNKKLPFKRGCVSNESLAFLLNPLFLSFYSSAKELRPFILRQLEYDPINSDKKRVSEDAGYWTLAYRTWRIDFTVGETIIGVLAIRSGYTPEELRDGHDTYLDKKLHQDFADQD